MKQKYLGDFVFTSFYLIWALTLIIDPNFLDENMYRGFSLSKNTYIGGFLSLFFLSFIGSEKNLRSKAVSGYVLILGSLAWLLTSFSFVRAYPPLNPHMLMFFILAWVCLIRGVVTIEQTRSLLIKEGLDVKTIIINKVEE